MAKWYHGDDNILSTKKNANTKASEYKNSLAVEGGFGSPAFNQGADGPKWNVEDVEIKLAHRFRVKFGIFKQIGQHVKTITKPNVTFAEVEVPKLNSKVYFAGRKTQDQMTIELDDSLDNAVTRATQTQLQKQSNFDNNLHAHSGGAYFFNVTSEELAGDGFALAAWYYDKCVVMTCDYGTLDYSDDAGTSTVNLGIRYSNFTTWVVDKFTYDIGKNTEKDGTKAASSVAGTWK